MKVLLTGAAGQLGHALRQQLPAGVELIATSRSGDPATGLLPLDLADAAACRAAVPTPPWTRPRAKRSWPWRLMAARRGRPERRRYRAAATRASGSERLEALDPRSPG